jgi:hypothetical protein
MKPDTLRGMAEGPLKALTQICKRIKARSRARVEYPFHVIKNLFGYRMVSYRGLAKNAARAKVQAALANPCIARGRLPPVGVGASAASRSSRRGPRSARRQPPTTASRRDDGPGDQPRRTAADVVLFSAL